MDVHVPVSYNTIIIITDSVYGCTCTCHLLVNFSNNLYEETKHRTPKGTTYGREIEWQ